MSAKWKLLFADNKKRNEFILTILSLAVVLFSLANFLQYVEQRVGVTLNDPILNLFTPVDLTWVIFGVIYIALIIALVNLIPNPDYLIFAVQCYSLMIIFRIAAMYVVPLNPPAEMIALADPFVETFGTGQLMTKDLFFSGHTATLFILYLTASGKLSKIVFLLCTIIVAVTILLQHVHYTIDVLTAPFFAYGSYVIIKKFKKY